MYCILRVKKLKTFGAIAGSCRHTFREQPTANANAERSTRNQTVGAKATTKVLATVRDLLPEKRRKDAVMALEYLVAASPEFFAGRSRLEYFQAALRWLRERHGRNMVVSATVHFDETTPHMVAYVVPITRDGRLAAKEFVGGADKLRRMQTDFAELVGRPFQLQRGLERSRASHRSIQAFYAALKEAPALEAPPTRMELVKAALGRPNPGLAQRLNGRPEWRLQGSKAAAEAWSAVRAQQAATAQALAEARATNALLKATVDARAADLERQAASAQVDARRLADELKQERSLRAAESARLRALKAIVESSRPPASAHGVLATKPTPNPLKGPT